MQTYIHTQIHTEYIKTCIHIYTHTCTHTYKNNIQHTKIPYAQFSFKEFIETNIHTNIHACQPITIHTYYIHTYKNGYIQCIHAYIRTRLQTFERLCISTLTACIHLFMHTHIQSCIHAYMHKYKRMRIHTHRHKISVTFCFLQNDVPTYTHINYITQIFMEIIRFKLQYDHFLVHFLLY